MENKLTPQESVIIQMIHELSSDAVVWDYNLRRGDIQRAKENQGLLLAHAKEICLGLEKLEEQQTKKQT